ESVSELAELAAAAELGFRFQITAADAPHESNERLHRPRNGARQGECQRNRRKHSNCCGGRRKCLRTPYIADKVRFRGDHTDYPDQVLTHAKRRGRAEVFGPVVAELEAMERFGLRRGEAFWLQIRAVGINERIARVREREEFRVLVLSRYAASIRVREENF